LLVIQNLSHLLSMKRPMLKVLNNTTITNYKTTTTLYKILKGQAFIKLNSKLIVFEMIPYGLRPTTFSRLHSTESKIILKNK